MASNAKPLILGHDNRLLDGSPAATDTASGYNVANITDLRPYTFWKAASAGTKYITVNCVSAQSADSLGIIGHNLYTADADVSVEHSPDGTNWTECLAAFTPASDKAVLKTFTTAEKQYWRIKIVTATIAPRIGVLVLGERMDFERYPISGFDPAPETLNAVSARSKAGHLIGAVLQNIGIETSISFRQLTTTWVENTFRAVWDSHLSQLKPFFFSWDITNHATEIYFFNIPSDFTLSMPFDPYRRYLSLTMEGIKEIDTDFDSTDLFEFSSTEMFTWI